MRKTLVIFIQILFIFQVSIAGANTRLPWVIANQDKIFYFLSKQLSITLRQNVRIGLVALYIYNGTEREDKQINLDFLTILTSQQYIYSYKIVLIEQVAAGSELEDISFIASRNEEDLIAFGKQHGMDVVLIASITILDVPERQIYDPVIKKFVKKRVAILQGNIFSTLSKEIVYRISHYLLID